MCVNQLEAYGATTFNILVVALRHWLKHLYA